MSVLNIWDIDGCVTEYPDITMDMDFEEVSKKTREKEVQKTPANIIKHQIDSGEYVAFIIGRHINYLSDFTFTQLRSISNKEIWVIDFFEGSRFSSDIYIQFKMNKLANYLNQPELYSKIRIYEDNDDVINFLIKTDLYKIARNKIQIIKVKDPKEWKVEIIL